MNIDKNIGNEVVIIEKEKKEIEAVIKNDEEGIIQHSTKDNVIVQEKKCIVVNKECNDNNGNDNNDKNDINDNDNNDKDIEEYLSGPEENTMENNIILSSNKNKEDIGSNNCNHKSSRSGNNNSTGTLKTFHNYFEDNVKNIVEANSDKIFNKNTNNSLIAIVNNLNLKEGVTSSCSKNVINHNNDENISECSIAHAIEKNDDSNNNINCEINGNSSGKLNSYPIDSPSDNPNDNTNDKHNNNPSDNLNNNVNPNDNANDNDNPNENANDNENCPNDEEGTGSNEDNLEDTVESISSFMLEEDMNLSRRAYRNFQICSLFIHSTLLVMVLLLLGILCHDFFRPSLSNKETVMIYFCGILLILLCLHICVNLYISIRLLRQWEVSKILKSVESKIHVIVLVYFAMCAYIYFFEGRSYPINSTFSFTIILAVIYYLMPIFLYIILRLIFCIILLILVFLKRKSPTPKRILKKLKVMKYIEYRKYCEECYLSGNYFYNEKEEIQQERIKNENAITIIGVDNIEGIDNNKVYHQEGIDKDLRSHTNPNVYTNSTEASCIQKGYLNKSMDNDLPPTLNNNIIASCGNVSNSNMINYLENNNIFKCDTNINPGENIPDSADVQICSEKKNDNTSISNYSCQEVNNIKSDNDYSNNNNDNSNSNNNDNSNSNSNNNNRNNYCITNTTEQIDGSNEDTKTGVFDYFQKVLKKKKNDIEKEKNEIYGIYENVEDNNSVHINIENSDYVCSICCVEYLNDDDICILPCNYLHYYHKECIFTWLKRNNDCPLCRKNIGKL
ncbi:RING zinc finger protein, putative [Plasmodium malariae]|uniref:RING zinc finger protein, putative n=1 Tax=Plasmodium malariae TaxID=5858 RepID=A0A1D3TDB9_PLAMA|nr:RING zinc finger protein, putative [Plasmodium malariae]SCP02879.1 RING zinc finger protein, putative [Plasmodium malariae]